MRGKFFTILLLLLFFLFWCFNEMAFSVQEPLKIYNMLLEETSLGDDILYDNNLTGRIVWNEVPFMESLINVYELTREKRYIELFVKHADHFDLEVITVDREEMRDLQLTFYRASVKNCEIPQDHAFLVVLYNKAREVGVHYILTGGNLATEPILPRSWGFNAADLRHILAIHRRFGTVPLRRFPMLSFWKRYLYYPFICGIREGRLLNYIPYNRAEAKQLLKTKFGWQDYGTKHYESVLTRFFQGYYLPTKFGIDKRKAHLSSLILAGQITKEEALKILQLPPYPDNNQLQEDKKYIAERLAYLYQNGKRFWLYHPGDTRNFHPPSGSSNLRTVLLNG